MSKEYSATSSGCPCYSDLQEYGVQGRWKAIKPPTPVSLVPEIFNLGIRPHNLAPNNGAVHDYHKAHALNRLGTHSHTIQNPDSCVQYRQLGSMCKRH